MAQGNPIREAKELQLNQDRKRAQLEAEEAIKLSIEEARKAKVMQSMQESANVKAKSGTLGTGSGRLNKSSSLLGSSGDYATQLPGQKTLIGA